MIDCNRNHGLINACPPPYWDGFLSFAIFGFDGFLIVNRSISEPDLELYHADSNDRIGALVCLCMGLSIAGSKSD